MFVQFFHFSVEIMTYENIREHCLSKKGTTEELPFDEFTPVFKVMGKIFAIAGTNSTYVNLKCDPEKAIELRAQYEEVTPAFHMNKKHWISVDYTGSVPPREIRSWIDASYSLVASGLTRAQKNELDQMK